MNATSLNRGASLVRDEETLPMTYAKYSDHYMNGQKIMDMTIEYLYTRELHDCAKIGTYMGLWQLAQASSALNVPVQSVFPLGGDAVMHLDFHRMFFPVHTNAETSKDPLIVMWTGMKKGSVPVHFVPLLPKRHKYEPFNNPCLKIYPLLFPV